MKIKDNFFEDEDQTDLFNAMQANHLLTSEKNTFKDIKESENVTLESLTHSILYMPEDFIDSYRKFIKHLNNLPRKKKKIVKNRFLKGEIRINTFFNNISCKHS